MHYCKNPLEQCIAFRILDKNAFDISTAVFLFTSSRVFTKSLYTKVSRKRDQNNKRGGIKTILQGCNKKYMKYDFYVTAGCSSMHIYLS